MKYCMDCGHYVPGGGEHNCSIGVKINDRAVCALKEACKNFIEREEEESLSFPKLDMRSRRQKRKDETKARRNGKKI